MRYVYLISGCLIGLVLVLATTAKSWDDTGGGTDIQESYFSGTGIPAGNIDLNGAYDIIIDADGDSYLDSGSVDDNFSFYEGGDQRLKIDASRINVRHHFRIDDDKRINLGSGDDYWLEFDSAGLFSLYTTNKDAGGGTDGLVISIADGVDDVVFGGGIKSESLTADPCGTMAEGMLFYNDTSDYYCFCDGAGVDKKVSDNGACF